MVKISAVYRIVNTATGDFYVGSSKDVKKRWREHKCLSSWKSQPNNLLYLDMQKYGLENFRFQILAPVMPDFLKQVEQEFIDVLHPTYNNYRADGFDVERMKKYKMIHQKTNKYKENHRKSSKKYDNQACSYNGEELTLCALSARFHRAGIEHPNIEAKKYLLNQQ